MDGTNRELRRLYGSAEETRRLAYAQAVGLSILVDRLRDDPLWAQDEYRDHELLGQLERVASVLHELRVCTSRSAWPEGARDCG